MRIASLDSTRVYLHNFNTKQLLFKEKKTVRNISAPNNILDADFVTLAIQVTMIKDMSKREAKI